MASFVKYWMDSIDKGEGPPVHLNPIADGTAGMDQEYSDLPYNPEELQKISQERRVATGLPHGDSPREAEVDLDKLQRTDPRLDTPFLKSIPVTKI